jgi:hypothetical protein
LGFYFCSYLRVATRPPKAEAEAAKQSILP